MKGPSGGNNPITTTVYSGLACLVQPVTAKWLMQYLTPSINLTHTVFFSGAPAIRNADVIVFGARKLRVEGVRNLQEWDRVLAVDCIEIQ